MNVSVWNVIKVFGAVWLGSIGYGAYVAMTPPLCGGEDAEAAFVRTYGVSCLRPLFPSSEPVDVYLYGSVFEMSKSKWATKNGYAELQRAPLWNKTGVDILEAFDVDVPLPLLEYDHLREEARFNGSLWIHAIVVRAGTTPDPTKTARATNPRPGVAKDRHARHYSRVDMLHASARLTRHLPPVRVKYTNLFKAATENSNSNDESAASSSLDQDEEDAFRTVSVRMPLIGTTFNIDVSGALAWTGLAFVLPSFSPPSLALALPRHAAFTIAGPWLVGQKRKLDALKKEHEENMHRKELNAKEKFLKQKGGSVTHLRPSVSIRFVHDDGVFASDGVSPPLYQKYFTPETGRHKGQLRVRTERYPLVANERGRDTKYVSPLYIDDTMTLRRNYRELSMNESLPNPVVKLEWAPISRIHYSALKTVEESTNLYTQGPMGLSERDIDDVKWMFARRPLHILVLMQVISMTQMLLSTLAFKNDIAFFKGLSDYTGLSSRSMVTDAIHSVVIFLYVYDYENASRILLFQLGAGALIAMWKVKKRLRLRFTFAYFLPWVVAETAPSNENNEQERVEREAKTDEIDMQGMRYLKYVFYPLSIGWGLYCLYNYRYKSWWSWLISSLADFAYTFGFINMCPQIFVNYKMKSVAHMPWRVMIYKFFNTFIDDVFAFVIMKDHMSAKHRWMTLRDDFIFFIFLYQRYLYPVDKKRADEYGFVYSDEGKTGESARDKVVGEEEKASPDDAKPDEEVLGDLKTDSGKSGASTGLRKRRAQSKGGRVD